MKDAKRALRRMDEEEKPTLVKHLEAAYGDALWRPDRPFEPEDRDMHMLFDIINDGAFQNRLGRGVSKFVLKAEKLASAPVKYRDLGGALAAFAAGQVRGQAQELILVRHSGKANLFEVVCSMMHEMIHMYDFERGPMGEQLAKYGAVAVLNWNIPLPDPRTGRIMTPRTAADLVATNLVHAKRAGFKSAEQLPPELRSQIAGAYRDAWPRQFQVPGEVVGHATTPDTGEKIPLTQALPKNFGMGAPDGLYDVHGGFFREWAAKFNVMGFAVTDVATGRLPRAMQKTYESEDFAPTDPAELFASAVAAPGKSFEYRDDDNWFFGFA